MTSMTVLLATLAYAFDPTPVRVLEGEPVLLYGENVAFAGDVDADGYDDMLIARWGAVELYYGGPGGPASTPDREFLASLYTEVGQDMGGIGDVNGDGFDDIAIAYNGAHLGPDEIEVYYGSIFGLSLTPDVVLSAPSNDRFGAAITHGDLTGDGIDELIVGSPGVGKVEVYPGSRNGLILTPSATHFSSADGHGRDLAVGDADGNGHLDILISNEEDSRGAELLLGDGTGVLFVRNILWNDGAVGFFDYDGDGVDTPITAEGTEIRLHEGTSPLFSTTQTVFAYSPWSMREISEPADVNGDGYDDLVVAASAGRAVLLGGPGGPPTVVPVSSTGYELEYHASLGDADGDGRADLLAGADWQVTLVPDPLGAAITHTWTSFVASAYGLGNPLDLGDVDGDGYDDLALDCLGGTAVCVHHGGLGGLATSPLQTLDSEQPRAASDIDGDGYGDLVLTQPGAIHVHRGGPAGLAAVPDQVLPVPASADVLMLDIRHDMNGDGDLDLIFFADANGKRVAATALGGPSGLRAPLVMRVHPGTFTYGETAFLGVADVDGDGYPDLIAAKANRTDLVWFQGSASGPGGAPIPMGLQMAEAPNAMVSGDFDGDGYADLALTSAQCDPSVPCGVIPGSSAGPDTSRMVPLTRRPLWAGDLDGDGLDDLVTGLPAAGRGEGEAAVHYGTPSGLASQEDERFVGLDGETLGSHATALDGNGDGSEELVVGAAEWNAFAGRVLVFAP